MEAMKGIVEFTKMEGLGNDYIYVDTSRFPVDDPSSLSVRLSDRHMGIGSDGLVLIGRSDKADFSMRIFNADGSEALMCGNASRCIGLYVFEKGLCDKDEITLDTLSGIKSLKINHDSDGKVRNVTVGMGTFEIDGNVNHVESQGKGFDGCSISVGNPHFVIFTDEEIQNDIRKYGPEIELDARFPNRVNVEFARVIAPDTVRMRVWERGSGITMACGTGACATAAAAYSTGRTGRKCAVIMDGGTLEIEICEDKRILMTGPANIVFEGKVKV